MFKKLRFRFRYRRLRWNSNPLKLFVDDGATFFSMALAKNRKVDQVGRLINEDYDLKDTIDDFGREDAPEQPPYEAVEFERMKRIRRTNFILMILFILCEGVFNYFALKAMLPGESMFIEGIRIVTAIVISVLALFLIENFIRTHFSYLMLEHKVERSQEEQPQLVRLNAKRKFYLLASVLLFIILIALGVIREFIIAGGTTVNFWIMVVTVGLAVIVAIALGLQGAEVADIINQYRRMVKWQQLKNRIDHIEGMIRDKLDRIYRKMEEDINNSWGWLNYLKMWLRRQYDDDDKRKTDDQKQQLVYRNFVKFKEKLESQSQETLKKLKTFETEYKKLINFDYSQLKSISTKTTESLADKRLS